MFYVYKKTTGKVTSACSYQPDKKDLDTRDEAFITSKENLDMKKIKIVGGTIITDTEQILKDENDKKLCAVNVKIRKILIIKLKAIIEKEGMMDAELTELYKEKEALEKIN